jgi:ribosomal protein L24
MAKAKVRETKDGVLKVGKLKKGDAVKIISGEHEGEVGKLVHLRQATNSAHVQPDSGAPVRVVDAAAIAAA